MVKHPAGWEFFIGTVCSLMDKNWGNRCFSYFTFLCVPSDSFITVWTSHFLFTTSDRNHVQQAHPAANNRNISFSYGSIWRVRSSDCDRRSVVGISPDLQCHIRRQIVQSAAWQAAGWTSQWAGMMYEAQNRMLVPSFLFLFPPLPPPPSCRITQCCHSGVHPFW